MKSNNRIKTDAKGAPPNQTFLSLEVTMDIIKKLKELSASWESRANSQMSDSYADATHDCVDDIDDLILHAQEPEVDIEPNKSINADPATVCNYAATGSLSCDCPNCIKQ